MAVAPLWPLHILSYGLESVPAVASTVAASSCAFPPASTLLGFEFTAVLAAGMHGPLRIDSRDPWRLRGRKPEVILVLHRLQVAELFFLLFTFSEVRIIFIAQLDLQCWVLYCILTVAICKTTISG
jgi:hypothetical protein